MLREERLDRLDHLAAVALEGVGRVVVAVAEEDADEPVGEAVDRELQPRVVVDPGAGHEARAEGAVPALLEQPVVADDVLRVVGGVGHHDHHRVALEQVEAGADRHPEALFVMGAADLHPRVAGADLLDHGGGAVLAGVVDRPAPRSRSSPAPAPRRRRSTVVPTEPSSFWAGMTTESFMPRPSSTARRSARRSPAGCRRRRGGASSPGSRLRTAPRSEIHQRWSPIRGSSPISQLELAAGDPLADLDRLQHRAVAERGRRRCCRRRRRAGPRWKAAKAAIRSALWMLSRTCLPS